MRAVCVRGRHFNSRQPSGLNIKIISIFRLRDESSWGGGLMYGIKIPQQDFALKMQGVLMREGVGGHICRTPRYIASPSYSLLVSVLFVICPGNN